MIALLLLWASSAFSLMHTLATNPKPCMPAQYNNAHNVFLKRHIPDGAPDSWDQNAWQTFLRRIQMCGRPTQSFFRSSETRRVDDVCSGSGGKALSGNLCISKEKFSFVTVRVNTTHGSCGIRNIRNESKHIIVACEDIGDVCLPVHFEGNPQNKMPSNNQMDCGAQGRSGTPTFGLNFIVLLGTLVGSIWV